MPFLAAFLLAEWGSMCYDDSNDSIAERRMYEYESK
jgi:hypothetical protein